MDKLFIVTATLCSTAQGSLDPLDTIVFANLLQSMVDYGKQSNDEVFLKTVLTFTLFNCSIGIGQILLQYLSTVTMNYSAANQVFNKLAFFFNMTFLTSN